MITKNPKLEARNEFSSWLILNWYVLTEGRVNSIHITVQILRLTISVFFSLPHRELTQPEVIWHWSIYQLEKSSLTILIHQILLKHCKYSIVLFDAKYVKERYLKKNCISRSTCSFKHETLGSQVEKHKIISVSEERRWQIQEAINSSLHLLLFVT